MWTWQTTLDWDIKLALILSKCFLLDWPLMAWSTALESIVQDLSELVAWTKGLLTAYALKLFLPFWGFELVKIMSLLVVWFAFPYLLKVESKVWRINLVIILCTLQQKVHIQEEAERISSRLEQEEVLVSTWSIY